MKVTITKLEDVANTVHPLHLNGRDPAYMMGNSLFTQTKEIRGNVVVFLIHDRETGKRVQVEVEREEGDLPEVKVSISPSPKLTPPKTSAPLLKPAVVSLKVPPLRPPSPKIGLK